jgi:hypothetical protein
MWLIEIADSGDISMMTRDGATEYLTWAMEAGFTARNVGPTVEVLGTVDGMTLATLYPL